MWPSFAQLCIFDRNFRKCEKEWNSGWKKIPKIFCHTGRYEIDIWWNTHFSFMRLFWPRFQTLWKCLAEFQSNIFGAKIQFIAVTLHFLNLQRGKKISSTCDHYRVHFTCDILLLLKKFPNRAELMWKDIFFWCENNNVRKKVKGGNGAQWFEAKKKSSGTQNAFSLNCASSNCCTLWPNHKMAAKHFGIQIVCFAAVCSYG